MSGMAVADADHGSATHGPAGLLVLLFLALAACGDRPAPQPRSTGAGAGAPTPAIELTAAAERAVAAISGDYLRGVIAEISADKYAGRGPATPGDDLTRHWLAAELGRLGFRPGGADGGWEQPFDLVSLDAQVPKTWSFAASGKTVSLTGPGQFIAASGVQDEHVRLSDAEVVFVGYGIEAPEYGWNDFKGRDLTGKVLLMLNNDPDWDPALFRGETRLYYGRWMYKYESAARQGAAGAIIIHTTPSAGYPWQVVQTSWSGQQFEVPTEGEPRVLVEAWVTEQAAQDLVALAGKDLAELVQAARGRDFAPVPLGIATSISFDTVVKRTRTANVLGLLPGTDPALGKEVVIVTAHHDHLGVGEPDAEGDRIYNGAIDNAAGVAQVLGIAKAFSALPEPVRRSVLINFVGAEEAGLLGSRYYAQHPTFPPGRIAANINYDGGNINGRARDLTFIGKGKSTLDAIVEAIAARQGRVVVGDQFPDRGFFYRSDQFNFAKIGVPALYIYHSTDFADREAGWGRARVEEYEARRYHQPSDEFSADWNYDGMVADAQAGFFTAYLVANADALPAWVPGDEFEAARKAALAALRL